MRRSRQEKAKTHAALLKRASRLFRERGIEATSVNDIMTEAGLTHGGFYRHFANKDALVAEAIRESFDGIVDEIVEQSGDRGAKAAVRDYLSFYLTEDHLSHPSDGCPIPTLAVEIGRSSEALKGEFSRNFNAAIDVIARGLEGDELRAHKNAVRAIALRAGAILIARASDPDLAKDILECCR